jgi:YD repeat-containing protein
VDGNGTTSYQYDHRNLMTQKTFPDTTTANWTYDAAENVKTQVDGAGTTTYGYDVDNFLSSVTEPTTSRVINFSVDNNGNRTDSSPGSSTDTGIVTQDVQLGLPYGHTKRRILISRFTHPLVPGGHGDG